MKRRIFAILLVVVMSLSLLPMSVPVASAANDTDVIRYNVLVLDASPSMSTAAMTQLKKAANRFTSQVLAANGQNYVAVIAYSYNAELICDFSDDSTAISNAIDRVDRINRNGTNTYAGLLKAKEILSSTSLPSGAIKNLVLMTDGMANTSAGTDDGPYTSADCPNTSDYSYRFANQVYNLAQEIKPDTNIYTLGFFQDFKSFYSDTLLSFAIRCLKDIQNSGYFEVTNGDDLEFVFGDIAEDIINPSTGKFSYESAYVGMYGQGSPTFQADFDYKNAYFDNPSNRYNQALATMSLDLALSAFDGSWVSDLLQQIGFDEDNINQYNYDKTPSQDSIAFTFAHKSLSESDVLIAIPVRGGKYGDEWGGNFRVGNQIVHEGFAIAFAQVRDNFNKYLNDNAGLFKGKNLKIWITGYSRGSTVANLLGAYFAQSIENSRYSVSNNDFSIPSYNVYTYCFATPANSKMERITVQTPGLSPGLGIGFSPDAQGLTAQYKAPDLKSITASVSNGTWSASIPSSSSLPADSNPRLFEKAPYDGIFCIISPFDPVPKFPFVEWGFRRFGITLTLPSTGRDLENMFSSLNKLNIPFNRDKFLINKYQAHQGNTNIIQKLLYNIGPHKGRAQETMDIYLNALIDKVMGGLIGSNSGYVKTYQQEAINGALNGGGFDGALAGLMSQLTFGALLTAATPNNNDRIVTLGDGGGSISQVRFNPDDFKNEAKEWNVTPDEAMEITRGRAANNFIALSQGHFPEIYLAYINSLSYDALVKDAIPTPTATGKKIIIHIACPVDVEVYNSGNVLVARIIDDIPLTIGNTDIIATVEENDNNEVVKLLHLPIGDDYDIRILATDDGDVTISVIEYDPNIGDALVFEKENIPVKKDDVLLATVNTISSDFAVEASGDNSPPTPGGQKENPKTGETPDDHMSTVTVCLFLAFGTLLLTRKRKLER